MANSAITQSAFVLTFDGGLDEEDKPVVLTKVFRNIKPAASADALLAIAGKLAPLQQHPFVSVERDDTSEITA
ncbi:DUF1659 domain-containing protein [Sporolactobacillus sp. Y61]|uniref:DUF1659 domain-containing protein n=1 Tax=Sporolactobacillus sp. Y61 TaxID=3160863 RepID=A0AAU8IIS3_9BACL|nr:DUF1659 domain-containing protein [Sporolactobacillus sp. THM19-2]RYL89282.1 DUF1659 domain-containing protein [Sporolactobacillus sp. THM19-2]